MKRALTVTTLLAMGFLMAGSPARAQAPVPTPTPVGEATAPVTAAPADAKPEEAAAEAPADEAMPAAESGGRITLGVLGRDDVASSKFQEYREVP